MKLPTLYQAKPILNHLGEGFADPVSAAIFPQQILRFRNQRWAERVGLGELTAEQWRAHFALFQPLPQNLPTPLALRYHGHQFRFYNPDLGDGRGFLFAQLVDQQTGQVLDLGTKGSGQTPYSRGGDGRLTLKGAIREILATEMLEALGVVTSKTLSVFETGESLQRNDEPSPTRSAVLVRLSHSHLRFGTFQRLAFLDQKENIQNLLAYSIRNYFPELQGPPRVPESARENVAVDAAAFLKAVCVRTADLCAAWMIAGFVHGVLNTDNMNMTGESFDYGPYRFLPVYDPEFTAAYFDHTGLYAYGRQPESVLWNLEQLAVSLRSVCEEAPLYEALQSFAPQFNISMLKGFLRRLGVEAQEEARDGELFMASFNFLAESGCGFAQFFHDWRGGYLSRERAQRSPQAKLYEGEHFDVFFSLLKGYNAYPELQQRLLEPYYQREKPCDLLIDEIEQIWAAIATDDDWSLLEKKIAEIREMGQVSAVARQ